MVIRRFVDDRILGTADRAGEPDNIAGSRSQNLWLYCVLFHGFDCL
jgi:hypothetical protein